MIPAHQREALAVLSELCELALASDIRLGQLFHWLGFLGEDQIGRGLRDLEDEELLAIMCHHREQLLARLPESEQQAFRSRNTTLLPATETMPA
jgi:hypothetical protein